MDTILPRHVPARTLALVLTLGAVAGLLGLLPGLLDSAAAVDRGDIFKFGGTINVPQADTADSVVGIGSDINVAGTVRNEVVAIGGNVHLAPTAAVGTQNAAGDTSVLLVGGTLTRASGATVTGGVSRGTNGWAGDIWDRGIAGPVSSPFSGFSLVSWLGGTVLSLLGAVLIAAFLPRQVIAVRDGVRRRFWPSLGWGALGLIVIVPVVTILLVITIIGLLAVLPWLFVVIATAVLGAVGVSVLIGHGILRAGADTSRLVLAAVIGVVVLRLVQLIPFVGSIIVAVAWIVGFGAAVMALWSWQRRRHEHARELREVRTDEQRAA
jgi:hypothetical protein